MLCYNYPSGDYKFAITSEDFGGRLFSISYSPCNGGALYAVSGPSIYERELPVEGFVFNLTSQNLMAKFSPTSTHVSITCH